MSKIPAFWPYQLVNYKIIRKYFLWSSSTPSILTINVTVLLPAYIELRAEFTVVLIATAHITQLHFYFPLRSHFNKLHYLYLKFHFVQFHCICHRNVDPSSTNCLKPIFFASLQLIHYPHYIAFNAHLMLKLMKTNLSQMEYPFLAFLHFHPCNSTFFCISISRTF